VNPDANLGMPAPNQFVTCGEGQTMAMAGVTQQQCINFQILAAAQSRCCGPPPGTPTAAPNVPVPVMCNNGQLQVDYVLDLVDSSGFTYSITTIGGPDSIPSSPLPAAVSGTACIDMANAGTLNQSQFGFTSGPPTGRYVSFVVVAALVLHHFACSGDAVYSI
jgi:hypothetical protein